MIFFCGRDDFNLKICEKRPLQSLKDPESGSDEMIGHGWSVVFRKLQGAIGSG